MTEISEHRAARVATLTKIASKLNELAEIERKGRDDDYLELQALNLIIGLWDCDPVEYRDTICDSNGWDEEGYPLDFDGNRLDPDEAREVRLPDGSFTWEGPEA